MDKIKILIVDDDAMLGATITLGLEAMGMQPVYQTSLAGLQASSSRLIPTSSCWTWKSAKTMASNKCNN